MDIQYIANCFNFSDGGSIEEDIKQFPKCRQGLLDALQFVNNYDGWVIWYDGEIVCEYEQPYN
jgi:hypothetical protein